jgi:hypothetical protein
MPTQRSTRQRAAARSNGRSASDSPSDVEVRRGVEELAAPLGDRLPEMVAAISFRSAFTDWGSVVLPVWHWASCSGSTSRRMHES